MKALSYWARQSLAPNLQPGPNMSTTNRTAKQPLIYSACATAVALMLSACGGGDMNTDKTPPTATITAAASGSNVAFAFTFSEDVGSSFTVEDVALTGATAGALTKVDKTHYTLVATPSGSGAVTATVAAAKFNDIANNANTASATASYTPAVFGATTGIDFSGSAVALEAFEGLVSATIENDPANAANKVAKFVKGPAGQPWAGATVFTVAADKSVGAIDFSASKLVTMRVYSPAPGKKIMLKFENAADATKNMEVEATSLTTKTNDWEVLTFDVTSKLNAAVTYNKISVFPNFLVAETANTTYYFDDLTFKTQSAGGGTGSSTPPAASGLVALTNGIYASNYSEKPSPWQSLEGGTAGRYVDDSVGPADWWSGLAANDATPSFYFGYGLPAAPNKAWGFGAFVKAPNNGFADVSSYKNIVVSVWGNDELVSTKPKFTLILKGAAVNACTPELKGEIAVAAGGVQTYTVALSSLALQTACGFTTVPAALAGGVGEVHIQVLGANVQYVKGGDTSGKYPNGLNMGPIKFN
jgi:hypothetical protein